MSDFSIRAHIPDPPDSSKFIDKIKNKINEWKGRRLDVKLIGETKLKEVYNKSLGQGIQAKNAKDFEKKLKNKELIPISLKPLKNSQEAKSLTHKEVVFIKVTDLFKAEEFTKKQVNEITKKIGQQGLERGLKLYHLYDKLNTALNNNKRFDINKGNLIEQWSLPIENNVINQCDQLLNHQPRKLSNSQLESLIIPRTGGSQSITKDIQQKERWLSADLFIRNKAVNAEDLTFKDLCDINRLVNGEGGEIRKCLVQAGGRTGPLYVNHTDVEPLLQGILEEINKDISSKLNPVITAAKAYQKMVSIHPFNDGNGRTCRLVMDYILLRAGLPPPALGKDVNVAIFGELEVNKTPTEAVSLILRGIEQTNHLLEETK